MSQRPAPRVAWLAAALALEASACAKPVPERTEGTSPRASLPRVALTERAQRDSARVAQLVLAYFDRVSRQRSDSALELFFPESIRVATPEGGVEVEGRSAAASRAIARDESSAVAVRRILNLRKADVELLEMTYRETWWLRYVPDRPDSAAIERRFHVLQQLGDDTRWLGKVDAGR